MSSYRSTLEQRFGADGFRTSHFRDNERIHISVERVADFLKCLKDECRFDMLVELTAVDYLQYPDARDRYEVIYGLANTETAERVWIKVSLNDPDPVVVSVYPLWKGADWMEREVFDMYGIRFDGHPDLRRILMPEEFTSYPLRKDYPLRGRGERHNFPTVTRADG